MKKHSKLPNGFGCIKRLSGNRRKPYAAYPSSKSSSIDPALNPTQAIGYYEDWYAAYNALMDYNENLQYSITPAATFSDVYHAFYKAKFVDSKKQLAVRSRMDYVTAFKNVPSLHLPGSAINTMWMTWPSICSWDTVWEMMWKKPSTDIALWKSCAGRLIKLIRIHFLHSQQISDRFCQKKILKVFK